MEKCDVLLTYEIKNREIENLCLVKRELERRGYTVKLRMQYETFFLTQPPLQARLVVVPAYYRPRHQFYTASHTVKTEKILNMMWEQVLEAASEQDNHLHDIKPWGRKASHIIWGDEMYEKLINRFSVPEDHAFKTGHIALDFLREPVVRYFEDRDSVFSAFSIPKDKRVHLFISSLAIGDMDMRVIKQASSDDPMGIKYQQFGKICRETREILVIWFRKILEENENDIIIYRPHPEESGCDSLMKLAEEQKRFFVIGERSVKQWILTSDKIYSWMSTSIEEVYAAGKECEILRPVDVPKDLDIKAYSNAQYITSFDEFRDVFISDKDRITLPKEELSKHYFIPQEKMSYELVCDAIEQILREDKYCIDPPMYNSLSGSWNIERFKNWLKCKIAQSQFFEKVHESEKHKYGYIRELIDDIFYMKQKLEKNYVPDDEIERIITRLDKAIQED